MIKRRNVLVCRSEDGGCTSIQNICNHLFGLQSTLPPSEPEILSNRLLWLCFHVFLNISICGVFNPDNQFVAPNPVTGSAFFITEVVIMISRVSFCMDICESVRYWATQKNENFNPPQGLSSKFSVFGRKISALNTFLRRDSVSRQAWTSADRTWVFQPPSDYAVIYERTVMRSFCYGTHNGL